MKGQQAMLYTGNTLREALGKALGTRDQYGRKIDRHWLIKNASCPEVIRWEG